VSLPVITVSRTKLLSTLTEIQYLVLDSLARSDLNTILVGGAVRDVLLGIPVDDLDFILDIDPEYALENLGSVLEAVPGIRSYKIYPPTAYRTVKVDLRFDSDFITFDFVFPRNEIYSSPAAKPKVSPGSIEEDLRRRDFSFNALAITFNAGEFSVLDVVDGLMDLERGQLRVLHDKSFQDDPIRIVRGLRFKHRYSFDWHASTRALIDGVLISSHMLLVSPGRRLVEFFKLAMEDHAIEIALELQDLGVLSSFVSGLKINDVSPSDLQMVHNRYPDFPKDIVRGAFFLDHISDEGRNEFLTFLPFDKKKKKQMLELREMI